MLSVLMLHVVMLKVVMLSIVMLSVVMLSVVMQNALAPVAQALHRRNVRLRLIYASDFRVQLRIKLEHF